MGNPGWPRESSLRVQCLHCQMCPRKKTQVKHGEGGHNRSKSKSGWFCCGKDTEKAIRRMGRGLFRMDRGQKHQQQHEEHVLFSVNTLDVISPESFRHIDDLRFKIQRAQEQTWNITNDERPTWRSSSKKPERSSLRQDERRR